MTANYILLERIELNNTASSVTFSNIPQTGYTDLKVVVSSRLDNTDSPIKVNFNGVTTGYSWRRIYGNGSSASSLSGTDAYYLHGDTSSMTASTFSNSEFYVPNYTSSNYKSISVDTALETNATGGELFMLAALWSNTAAITSINMTPLTGSFVANSTFSLYGIAAVGTTPVTAPKADGGNVIATDGTYWYHAFLSNGTFTPTIAMSADVLVIGGGGAGAEQDAGGGGAGGIFYATSQTLTTTGYTCTVGAGGSYSNTQYANGDSGTNSTFGSLTAALGGGGGGGTLTSPAPSGGSGGGGASTSNSGGVYGSSTQTSTGGTGYGNRGGSGAGNYTGGGGGGAGAVGGNANGSNLGGAGGAGLNTWSSWASATGTGASGYYAGGGAGAGDSTQSGGAGGGGNSANGGAAGDGVANTGGGGGGQRSYGSGSSTRAGSGGSGIIIIRYPIAS